MTRGAPFRRADRGDVAVLVLDSPRRRLNVVDEEVIDELGAHFRAIGRDQSLRSWVLASGKPTSFGAGADISWLPQLAARPDAEQVLAAAHDLMQAIVAADKPLVTALNGPAYGGALEIALAGHAVVAVPDALLGLPEVGLGLMPGGGGTQLLLRWTGLDDALQLLLSGKPVTARVAADCGLVTKLTSPANLLDCAVALARELADGGRAPDRQPAADPAVDLQWQAQHGASDSRSSASTQAILRAVHVGCREGPTAGLGEERRQFLGLLRSSESRAQLHLFSAERAARVVHGGAIPWQTLGIVGAGQMGSGIGATAVASGIRARVRDVGLETLARSRGYVERVLGRAGDDPVTRRRIHLWSGTTGWEGFARADAVIETVWEAPELKAEILSEVSSRLRPGSLVATNTSAIPISTLATAVRDPAWFLGMHFFSPVERMPLVELIPHVGTSPEALARASRLARRLGKTAIVAGDAPGFFTSRVYARWALEGLRLLLEGFPVDAVDGAAHDAGFPVGPLQAFDEATLELALHASIAQVAEPLMDGRIDVVALRAAVERLLAAGVEGRRHGRGFYRYDDGQRTGPDPEVLPILGAAERDVPRDERPWIGQRLLLAFATESALAWDDGILCHPQDGDVASVLGIGFPRRLGGPFFWIDELGAANVAGLCGRVDPRAFPTATSLAELASVDGRYGDLARHPTPPASQVRR